MTFEELQEMHNKALVSAKYWQQRAERFEGECGELYEVLSHLSVICPADTEYEQEWVRKARIVLSKESGKS